MFMHTIELALGNIEIYSKKCLKDTNSPYNGFYWVTTNNLLDEHGPFPSLFDAGKNYSDTMKASLSPRVKALIEPKPAPEVVTEIIHVDFAGKKRIS